MSRTGANDPRRSCRGMTLLEVTLATVVAGVGMSAAMSALSQAAIFKTAQSSGSVIADELAKGIHVLALSLPRDTWDGSPATSAANLDVFEDLGGAVFQPPVTAGRFVRADLPGWSQRAVLTKVALDDPSRAAILADGDAYLWEMRVTIKNGVENMGDFSWWIDP
jgi:prepilin-type N-terminal cleavage/methylation domain-containing protein